MKRLVRWLAVPAASLVLTGSALAQQGIRTQPAPQRAEVVRQNIVNTLRKQVTLAKAERAKTPAGSLAWKSAQSRVETMEKLVLKYESLPKRIPPH